MKRTKELYYRPHPDASLRTGISAVKELDGEDLEFDSRNKYYQTKQREWADQQSYENYLKQEQLKQEEADYAKQTKEVTRMRQMLEDEFSSQKQQVRNDIKDINQNLAQERRDKEKADKAKKKEEELAEAKLMWERGQKKSYVPIQGNW